MKPLKAHTATLGPLLDILGGLISSWHLAGENYQTFWEFWELEVHSIRLVVIKGIVRIVRIWWRWWMVLMVRQEWPWLSIKIPETMISRDEVGHDYQLRYLVSLPTRPLPGQGCPGQDEKGAGQHLVIVWLFEIKLFFGKCHIFDRNELWYSWFRLEWRGPFGPKLKILRFLFTPSGVWLLSKK